MSKAPAVTAVQAVRQLTGLIEEGHQLLTPALCDAIADLICAVARGLRKERELSQKGKSK